ncbi:MAG: sensor histidine kinase [Gemmatimonadales bacterium]
MLRAGPVSVAAVGFAVLTAVSALQIYALRRAANEPISPGGALLFGTATWVVWAVAAPGIVALGRRFDFRRGRRLLSAGVHGVVAVAIHLPATVLLLDVAARLFSQSNESISRSQLVQQLFGGTRLQLAALLYLAILGLDRGVAGWRVLREREAQAARLEALATRARLEALASRLQPHFLFNALHAAGALIDESPGKARAMLVELGDLLRRLLADPDVVEVSLADELALLEHYLAIERIRFADRLVVETAVPPELGAVRVPRLLLQPLVENALRHGLARRAGPGRVRISGRRDGEVVRLRVWNDGVLDPEARDGHGLAMTRARLTARFGDAARLSLGPAEEGVAAEIVLPADAAGGRAPPPEAAG